MPLTKINSDVIDVVNVSTSLKNNTVDGGVRDYVDDQITATTTTINGTITTQVAAINSEITNIKTTLIPARGDMFKSDNLSGLTDASVARSNIGIVIGSSDTNLP